MTATQTKPQVGKKAPAFTVVNQNGQTVSLDDYEGQWVVLYFYPKDDTPGCTIEACEFTSGLEQFNKLNAVVLGVSADSPESHKQFIKKFNLKFDLLADEQKKMLQAYGVWVEKERDGKKSMGISRQTFIIDPHGKIVHHWPQVTPQGHADDVAKKLREAGAK